jgi:hypothetical protein
VLLKADVAGYSNRSLVEKLGVKPGTTLALVAAPRGYRTLLSPLPPGVRIRTRLAGRLSFIQFFCTRRGDLARRLPALKRALESDGALWVSWPKGSSGVATDVNENIVRDLALANGLVDVKVCAVDDVWSGLKLVRRLRDRATGAVPTNLTEC